MFRIKDLLSRGKIFSDKGVGLTTDGVQVSIHYSKSVSVNPDAKKKLESIIHPFVRREFEEAVASLKSDETLVYEIPLLVETGGQDRFDVVVTVESSLENRIARLRQRGMHISEIEGRIAAQATREQRIEVADFLIENDGSEDELLRQVENIWDSLHDN